MKKIAYHFAFLVPMIFLACASTASAKWGTFTMTDDNGEQVVVKHGLFGKKTIVKDRFGDGFEHKRSIFGLTKDTEVGALGNDVHVHKGLFSFSKTEGHDILGDTVTSHKNPLYRNTNVDLSGVNNLVNKYFGPKTPNMSSPDPNTFRPNPGSAGRINPPVDPNATVPDYSAPNQN